MTMFFVTIIVFLVLLIVIKLRGLLLLLLPLSIFYFAYKGGIFTGTDIIGILAGFAVIVVVLAYFNNAKRKSKEKKKLEAEIQRLANFSHYIPKDDYPELYEKKENDDWKQKPS